MLDIIARWVLSTEKPGLSYTFDISAYHSFLLRRRTLRFRKVHHVWLHIASDWRWCARVATLLILVLHLVYKSLLELHLLVKFLLLIGKDWMLTRGSKLVKSSTFLNFLPLRRICGLNNSANKLWLRIANQTHICLMLGRWALYWIGNWSRVCGRKILLFCTISRDIHNVLLSSIE